MSFEIDNETYRDLGIFHNDTGDSIYSIYDKTQTAGGAKLLYRMMQEPLSNKIVLEERVRSIKFCRNKNFNIELNYHQLDSIDYYLSFNKKCLSNNPIDALYDHYNYKINPSQDHYQIITGIENLLVLLKSFSILFNKVKEPDLPDRFGKQIEHVKEILQDDVLKKLIPSDKPLRCFQINYLDNLFRKQKKDRIKEFLEFVYEIDVLGSLAALSDKQGWCYPKFHQDKSQDISFEKLIHPGISEPVSNDSYIDEKTNVIFLTGPNMAGKSSFLKAVGIAVYLSHLGFPVPAEKIRLPVFKGLITTINLPDNLHEGLSHFYSEVKRIKKTITKLAEHGEVFVIFDELFRGTNLKDAFEATLLITSKLSMIHRSKFMISSHFTEITDELKKLDGIAFQYFECNFVNEKPVFSYKIKHGISEERLGMYILHTEEIFTTLDQLID
ncbi:MutS-related protein [Desertivirga xinjiangensis]|uniref:MutS-related protein n=1 Tax=Desertivirga xinjiangensis TaxID=539206 RepID=UPI00210CE404|nr:hypothetical protein [Pedobacter xinjiangensis]